ncbi:hypothetical protein [Nocardia suismassiliense]|uniref:hypothetical protein n=1 Tax=Nocardia suismassiliense TaxID=2077092 RepID=UPI000D1E56D8|nr:hypothetical protein [Nocardia suismassiliense]
MAADPDIVLNTAADPARAAAWLPITRSAEDAAEHYEIRLSADEHLVRWRPHGADTWSGWLRVTESGAGASEAELGVHDSGELDADALRAALDRSLHGLAGEVEQNFNVS